MQVLNMKPRILWYKQSKYYKPFTTQELNILIQNYPYMKTKELSKMINISSKRIGEKAWKMGLKKTAMARRPTFKLNLTESQKGYLAGLIDGDGTISIQKHTKGKYIIPYINISSISPLFLKQIYNLLQTSDKRVVYFGEHKQNGKGRNRIYRLMFKGSGCHILLNEIKDHLILKQKQAEIVIKFLESRYQRKHKSAYTEYEVNLVNEIRKLNERRVGKYE